MWDLGGFFSSGICCQGFNKDFCFFLLEIQLEAQYTFLKLMEGLFLEDENTYNVVLPEGFLRLE